MSVVGVAAEYNPFHTGHQYHIRRTRELCGEESTVVCVMSGDFVQRGEAAIYDKFTRAEAACRGGADLVVELPLPWCLSSAEGFARGAISLLDGLGCDALSFGSESGELPALERLAEALLSPELNEAIRAELKTEAAQCYAAARQRAVASVFGKEAALLGQPNDILAIEYIKAIRTLGAKLRPLAVPRLGSRHDGRNGAYPSAAELREKLRRGEPMSGLLPPEATAVFDRVDGLGRGTPERETLEAAVLARLRFLPDADFETVPDGGDGLGLRLLRAACEEPTLEAVCAAVKSKRYALSRVRRMALSAALGLRAGMNAGRPPYARVLAANERGRAHLAALRDRSLPILTKPAAIRSFGGEALTVFELGARAHDLYVLGCRDPEARRGGEDWRRGPAIL